MTLGPISEGLPHPLGVWPSAGGINVAVWSSVAEAIDLCLFDDDGREQRIRLPARTGEVFHGHVAGIGVGARYGLRVQGPWDPARGLRCDPSKLLIDPYAVALDGPFILNPAMFSDAPMGADSAPVMPKAVVTEAAPPAPPPLVVPWDRTVIYEAHVKGLTQLHPEAPEAQRGTFAALAHPAVIGHLKALGVTTLEPLPTAAWIDERHLGPVGLTNYWGYNPVTFCAPDPRLAPGGWAEIKAATAALAEAGIETMLDVVFNHSGEGDHLGPTLSLRGLDNGAYYRLRPDDPTLYIDDSGTGDTLALDRPPGLHLAMEAMRTWVRRGGIAGFRFDLAPVLGRCPDGFNTEAPLLAAIAQDPELSQIKLIAEPWDCGPGGYQLGRFPGAWGEWNDQYRDTVRRFWKGDGVGLGALAGRLAGSEADVGSHRRPSRSVNFVTAHDGFSLADLVAYETKHNQANGEDNRDGTGNNASWNNGVEGPSDVTDILARRARDQRALLATLMLSRGTPMLQAGAEFGHSQGGNNNAYCQDNAISWLDWTKTDDALLAFARRLGQARQAHPALRADRFLTGAAVDGPWPDVEWRRADGAPLQASDWDDPNGAALTMVLTAQDDRVAVLIHRGQDAMTFALPGNRDGFAWRLELDTADDAREGAVDSTADLAPRSIVLLSETADVRAPRGLDDATLARVAEAAGITSFWWTIEGERTNVRPDTQRALLKGMGFDVQTPGQAREALWRLGKDDRRALPVCHVLRQGEPAWVQVRSRDAWVEVVRGGEPIAKIPVRDGRADLPALEPGRYMLLAGDVTGRLIVTPNQAYEPADMPAQVTGISAQLYSVRGAADGGMGDFATLAELARGAAAQGLGLIALNPFHALFPQNRGSASPYYPSDRRFLDPIHIHVPGIEAAPGRMVDYEAVWASKSAALEAEFKAGRFDSEALDRFVAEGGLDLERFATFQTIAETHGGSWRAWSGGLADAGSAETRAFAHNNADRLRFHHYAQWRADAQLAQAAAEAAGLGFCRDLAVGAAPGGAEVWAGPQVFVRGVAIGAPPDRFSAEGQIWGLPPPDPRRWREDGYDAFARLLAANMKHAGALRIDHVLGLARLFWIPDGASGSDGAYVRYPLNDLLGVLALESQKHCCLVVGEDLGTLPDGLRPALEDRRVYSYKVLPFEREGPRFRPPASWPAEALACVATHDLPPLAGWWVGKDLDERRTLGLLDEEGMATAMVERSADKVAVLQALVAAGLNEGWTIDSSMSDALAGAIHAFVALSPCRLALAQLDDLAGETEGVNLPGTDQERPNWRRRLGPTLDQLWAGERSRAILKAMTQA